MKKRKKMLWVVIVVGIAAIGGILWGPIVSNVEQSKYQIISTDGDIQIRLYAPMIIAETVTQGDRQKAINDGFRILADYIFGNNTANTKIAMTTPVTQQSGTKIAMTAPVTQQAHGDQWTIHFVMPSEYTLETLPKPNNKTVSIKKISEKKFAVLRFSGMSTQENISKHEVALKAYLSKHNMTAIADPAYAFFNPPWTLPPLRRNEVMMEIKKPSQ
jgi:Tfp pilus assembly major pilin PilA